LHGTKRREDLFLSVCESIKELELLWVELKRVTTDWTPKYDWKENRSDRIRRERPNKIANFKWNFTASSVRCLSVEKLSSLKKL
jgi:hypothetical protein